MKNNTIITIGRQFGSGGREIGEKLSKKLGIPFYDRDLIALAAEKSGYNEGLLQDVDERTGNPFFLSLAATTFATGSRASLPTEISINDRLFFAQVEVIKELANKGSCVIVGRCADYILRDREECINAFIYADLGARIDRVARIYSITTSEAKNVITKTDKKRASYYNYYSNKDWSRVESYSISINSGTLGIDGTVDIIKIFAEKKDRERSPGI